MKRLLHLLSFTLLFLTIVAARGDLTNGLVSYWSFDSTNADSTVTDFSFGNTMNAVGGPLLGPGTNGNALTFNGTSRYLGLTNAVIGQWSRETNGLPIWGAGAYSVVFWVK